MNQGLQKMFKKMCSNFRTGNVSSLIGYTTPTLHKGVRWFVDFFALDSASNDMRRKRYYIGNNLTISTDFYTRLRLLVEFI